MKRLKKDGKNGRKIESDDGTESEGERKKDE